MIVVIILYRCELSRLPLVELLEDVLPHVLSELEGLCTIVSFGSHALPQAFKSLSLFVDILTHVLPSLSGRLNLSL